MNRLERRGLVMTLTKSFSWLVGVAAVLQAGSLSQGVAFETLEVLAWIAGDWQTPASNGRQVDEHWTMPLGGTMMGVSRTVAGGKTVEFEYLRIEDRADGTYYLAHPNARAPGTEFKLTKRTAGQVTFENPKHDFPKRIIYRKNTDGSMAASVDGGEGTRGQSFPYQPMKRQQPLV